MEKIFRTFYNGEMATQGEPDLETLGSFMHHYSDCELEQFTGLKDKNGVKIFEGDIITYKRSIGNWTSETMTTTHEIVFSDKCFSFVMKYGNSYIKLRKHWGYEYIVIGNIHENKELL